MGHFGPAELAQIEAKGLTGPFDLAVDGGQQQYPRARARILGAGKGLVTYFNVHDVQPEVVRGEWRAPWFSFLALTALRDWGAVLTNAAGDTAFNAYYGGDRVLLNWAVIDSARAEALVQAQLRAAGPGSAAFWDAFFPDLGPWMFSKRRGARFESIPVATRVAYRENILRALRIARRTFSDKNPRVPFAVIVNGDWTAPPPVYLEGMEQSPLGSFRKGIAIWRSDPGNVASVRAHHTQWVDSLIAEWKRAGGTIAFTGDAQETGVKAAYERAEAARQ